MVPTATSAARLLHLHTYFFFPFAIDKAAILETNGRFWSKDADWMTGLDEWIASMCASAPRSLGSWQRAAYDRFDLSSAAYQDMVFFHPFVRRVFFDSRNIDDPGSWQPLMRCYKIPLDAAKPLRWTISDARKRSTSAQISDLRLFMFANGIGILSIGVERDDLPFPEALYLNEMMRKVFPSSDRQRREGRIPSNSCLVRVNGAAEEVVACETFESGDLVGFHPPLSRVIRTLLYFLHYEQKRYEQVLDERMIVYTYAAVDPGSVPEDYIGSQLSDLMLSRLLYVDRDGEGFRYDPEFTARLMREDVYRRWAHEGTLYGFTRYSNVTVAIGVDDRGEHLASEGTLIHRMFNTRYYLMAIIALFYRATLLNFAEQGALVSEDLYRSQERGEVTRADIRAARNLQAGFLHFSNYWYFDELANKDEEIEHFTKQCEAYRIEFMRREMESEIDKLNAFLREHNQQRSTEAVNRLALLSMILGVGAVLTGYFGMNFGRVFARMFFEPQGGVETVHNVSIAIVSVFACAAVALGFYVIAANWSDYRDTFRLRRRD
jgi:hypothetical protein